MNAYYVIINKMFMWFNSSLSNKIEFRSQSYKNLISLFFPNFATKLGHLLVNALFSSAINTQA